MELSVHIENKIKKSLNTVNSNIESPNGLLVHYHHRSIIK